MIPVSIRPRMEAPHTPERSSLDRQTWIHAALDVLAEDGVDSLRVESLAKHLGVTKGSFYWHFRDRAELLSAVLDDWKEGRIHDIVKQTTATPGSEADQLLHMIDVYSASRNRKGIRIELAIRDWARRDAGTKAVVAEVDTTRLECGKRVFMASGMDERQASTHTVLLYAYVFGLSLMHYEGFHPDLPGIKQSIANLIAGRAEQGNSRV